MFMLSELFRESARIFVFCVCSPKAYAGSEEVAAKIEGPSDKPYMLKRFRVVYLTALRFTQSWVWSCSSSFQLRICGSSRRACGFRVAKIARLIRAGHIGRGILEVGSVLPLSAAAR